MEYFLYPHKLTDNKHSDQTKYFIFYQYQNVQKTEDTVFLDTIPLWTGYIYDFSNNGFIFVRN
jgi:hypothetical protein